MDSSRKPIYGRERVLFELVQGVLAPQPQSFSLVGPKLIGKTHLLHHLAGEDGPLLSDAASAVAQRPRTFADGSRIVVTWIDCDWQDAQLDLVGWLYENVQTHVRDHARIALDWTRVEAQPTDSRRVWQLARELTERGLRLVVLLDNFDRVFENQLVNPDTVDELRPLTLEMALVVSTEQPLHDLDRELAASPLFNVMTQLFMGLVEPAAARAWIMAYPSDFPGVSSILDELLMLTGQHPFLLRRLGDIFVEVQQMMPGGPELGSGHLPLLRLRLAEHGRLLFETNWKRLQRLPARLPAESVQALVQRMVHDLLPLADVQLEQTSALNWLINQAMVTCCNVPGETRYELFTPLFAEFLARRLTPVAETAARPLAPAASESAIDLDQFTKIEASLLRYFQSRPHETISTEQLLADVWKRPGSTNRRVQEAIRRLRLQLEEMVPAIGSIENDRGRGYRFIPA